MSGRMKRVNQLLKEEISKIIQKELDNPSIGFVTVTQVDTKPDLDIAKVYISIMQEDKKKALDAINRSSSYIKKLLSSRINIRYMPDLKFIEDKSIERSAKLDELFKKIDKEGREKNDH